MHGYRSLKLDPEDKNIYYNIASAYSLKEIKIEMIEALEKAIDFDCKHRKIAGNDRDFAMYKDDPDFIALINDNEEDQCDGYRVRAELSGKDTETNDLRRRFRAGPCYWTDGRMGKADAFT